MEFEQFREDASLIPTAFGIQGEFEWSQHKRGAILFDLTRSSDLFYENSNDYFSVSLGEDYLIFQKRNIWNEMVWLMDDGTVRHNLGSEELCLFFARLFYRLGLLTDYMEHKLGVTISHHERLEWQLEYEARLAALEK